MRVLPLSFALCAAATSGLPAQFPVDFTATQRLAFTAAPERLALADLNGDGALDAISERLGASPQAVFGAGDGTFSSAVSDLLPQDNYDLGLGDVDGDGDLDLVTSSFSYLTTHLNNGAGSFTAGPLSIANVTAEPLGLADFDADGFLDVALHVTNGVQLELYFGDGTGAFAGRVAVNLASMPSAFAVLELGTSAPPEIASTHADRTVSVIRRTAGRSFAVSAGPTLTYPSRIEQVVDFDADGRQDLLLVGNRFDLAFTTWGVTLLAGDGAGGFRPEVLQHAGPEVIFSARAASFDALGDPDLLVMTASEDILWQRNASGTRRFELEFPYRSSRTAVGDFDRDGDADILRTDGFASPVRSWENQSRYELRLSFDEASGAITYDSARGDEEAFALRVFTSAPTWQGDPGPGRAAFRGNDAGSGMLARGRGSYISTQFGSGALRSQTGSFTIAWWQRMGTQAPSELSTLWEAAGLKVVTGDPVSLDHLTIVAGYPFTPQAYTSATSLQQPNHWLHVALTVDTTTGALQLWFDGVRDAASATVLPQNLQAFGYLGLGASIYGATQASLLFDLDEFRYFPRMLGAAEIAALQSGDGATVAPLGAGCYERRASEGLHVSGLLRPGGNVDLALDTTGQIGGVAAIVFGISSAHWGGAALPIDFGFGCILRTSIDAVVAVPIGRNAEMSVRLPSTPGALQGHIYLQGLILGAAVQTTRAFDLKLRY